MNTILLNPKLLWDYFLSLSQIPRPSGGEQRAIEWLIGVAEEHNLDYRLDQTGNLRISAPATSGYETRPLITMQAHVDMVCEKRGDSDHNFESDPIECYIDEGWLRARGTTLGADCGIGVAAALAALTDPDLAHPPLDALFTLDEERGLSGAFGLGEGMIRGGYLLNLDSEDEGEIFIGCAGGIDTIADFSYSREVAKGDDEAKFLKIEFSGALGGHSGDDINKGRANSLKILARMVAEAIQMGGRLVDIKAGNLRNAIPREGWAVISHSQSKESYNDLLTSLEQLKEGLLRALEGSEPNAYINIEAISKEELRATDPLDESTQNRVIGALSHLINGVIEMSKSIEGLVETSSNLASIRLREESIRVVTSQRSSSLEGRDSAKMQVSEIFSNAGAKVSHSDGYPGWSPNPDSPLLQVAQSSHARLFGSEAKVRAIHAGLECGLFLERNPNLDMISFGPTMRGVHSPDERLDIASTERFYLLLSEILKSIES
ncbi:MAG: aminoacyl-histidine dipeptidase [Rikenellaceae bacterium]